MQQNQCYTHRVTKGHQSQTKRTEQTKQPGLPKPAPKGAVASSSSSVADQTTIVPKAKKGKVQNDPLTEAIESQKTRIERLLKRHNEIEATIKNREDVISGIRKKLNASLTEYKTAKLNYERPIPEDDKRKYKSNYRAAEQAAIDKMWDISMEEGKLDELRAKLEGFQISSSSAVGSMKSELTARGVFLPPVDQARNL